MFLSRPRDTAITFAEPADGEPFSFSLANLPARLAEAGDNIDRGNAAMRKVFTAAERSMQLVDNFDARNEALAEAAQLRIDIAREKTGVVLENPFRQGYHMEARRRLEAARARGELEGPIGRRVLEEQRSIFLEKFDELATQFPDQAAALQFFQPIADQAKAIARGAADDLDRALASPDLTTAGALLGGVGGGISGGFRDPLVAATLFMGGGVGTASSVIGRIGQVSMRESIINGLVMTAIEPEAQRRRAELDLPHGVQQALTNIGLGFLLGGAFGGGLQGGRELVAAFKDKALAPVLDRVARGAGTAEDIEQVVTALGGQLRDEDRAAIAAAVRAQEAETITGERPPAVPQETHEEIAAQAIRHAEDPVNEPPAEIALPLPARAADQVKIIDETVPAKAGDVETVDGKRVTFERFDPAAIETDAATFQFKGGGDEHGVTERLRHVTQWDALASGKSFVFERVDGKLLIADGHQRLGLAKKLLAEDHPPIRLDGYRFREADGWTAADVRALAAKKNLQEGSGDAIDIAKILRERPDILDGSLPITSPAMKAGVAIARLSDDAFGMVVNGVVPPNHAAAVGAMVPDPLQHQATLTELARHAPETDREARLLIGEIMAAGFRAEEQINLFGAAEMTRSLMAERVKVLDQTLATLSRDKRLFGTLAERADVIEEAGNVLDRDGNVKRATDAATIAEIVARIAGRTGPVSDALNAAAQRVADGEKPATVAREFLNEVGAMIERDGLAGVSRVQELKPEIAIEPGTAAAGAAAAVASPEASARADVLAMIARGATKEEISAHPLVKEAMADALARPETSALPGYGTPEFQAARAFQFGGETVIGYEAAIARLTDQARAYAGAAGVRSERQAVIVLGPPASGKSRLSERIATERGAAIADPDDAKKPLPEFDGGKGARAVHTESADLAAQVLGKLVDAGDNLVLPKVGARAETIRGLVQDLKANGYAVSLVNLTVDPEEAYRRMVRRAVTTGRWISSDYFDDIGTKPRATYHALKGENLVEATADIDGNGREHVLIEGAGELAGLEGSRPGRSGDRGAAEGAAGTRAEATEAGQQILIPGVEPVTTRDRLQLEAARPLRGGQAPAGGLFDDAARSQVDLMDLIPIERGDGSAGLAPRELVIADAERQLNLADLVRDCRG